MEWFTILVVVAWGATLIGIICVAIYDYKEGAVQTYIRDDGTIHEWDRFGNHTLVKPDGDVEMITKAADKGIGRTHKK